MLRPHGLGLALCPRCGLTPTLVVAHERRPCEPVGPLSCDVRSAPRANARRRRFQVGETGRLGVAGPWVGGSRDDGRTRATAPCGTSRADRSNAARVRLANLAYVDPDVMLILRPIEVATDWPKLARRRMHFIPILFSEAILGPFCRNFGVCIQRLSARSVLR